MKDGCICSGSIGSASDLLSGLYCKHTVAADLVSDTPMFKGQQHLKLEEARIRQL